MPIHSGGLLQDRNATIVITEQLEQSISHTWKNLSRFAMSVCKELACIKCGKVGGRECPVCWTDHCDECYPEQKITDFLKENGDIRYDNEDGPECPACGAEF